MTLLVTGAAGFIGSHVTHRLLEQGQEVVGFDVLNDAYDVQLKQHRVSRLVQHPRFHFLQGDMARPEDLQPIPWQDIDSVYHLGARAGVRQSIADPHAYVRDNVTATINVLESARRHDVDAVVLASTSSLYGDHNEVPFREDDDTNRPLSPYAASKKGAEAMAACFNHLHGLSTPVLRFFTVYGPAGRPDMSIFRFIHWIMEEQPVRIFGDGHQSRDFTFVEDIARGVLAAGQYKGHRVFNLGGDKPHSLLEVLGLLRQLLGKTPDLRFQDAAPADVPRTWADITAAQTELGWSPKVSLEDGLERTVQWHKDHQAFVRGVDLGL